jgi:hypothetical protein
MTTEARTSRWKFLAPHLLGPLGMCGAFAAVMIGRQWNWGIDAIFAAIVCGLAINAVGLVWQAARLIGEIRRRRVEKHS